LNNTSQDNKINRRFLKSTVAAEGPQEKTDREKGLPRPPVQKPVPDNATVIGLTKPDGFEPPQARLMDVLRNRKSRRMYTNAKLSQEELSFLLWASQGLQNMASDGTGEFIHRTVPSSGACHAFETYVLVSRIAGLEVGLYRYLPLSHSLCFLYQGSALLQEAHAACLNQYVRDSAVAFFWTVIPYRAEWGYGDISYKALALDAGHVCQNLYLACEAIKAGMCAIGAYDQEKLDRVLRVDGRDEFAIYAATVGKID
jgi:SagB-type dehydrogenase family enzyme